MTHDGDVFAAGSLRKTTHKEKPAVYLSRVMLGKPGVTSIGCAAGHCSRENPALLTYAASGNIVLPEDRQFFCASRP